ncbi:hypothetical protein GCM10023186_17570 [Hymenobacter koreensis]|uniref:Lipoprotein n=1 Tax=Hymenobacter koreensis TaxID=1084523 RepID=A0ABP8IYX5_9BACT
MANLRKYTTSLRLILLSTLLYSCHNNNNIYYDTSKEAIVTCSGKNITSLHIVSNKADFYHFKKIPKKAGTNTFNLKNINNNYKIEDIYKEIDSKAFSLKPNTIYKVSNTSIGDAAYSEIEIRTDERSKIIFSNTKSCK